MYFPALILLVLMSTYTFGGDPRPGQPIVIGESITLESKVLQETRPLMISTPPTYTADGAPYPVLYVLDAEAQFIPVHGLVHELSRAGEIPPMIVVGIPNTARTRDMTPTVTESEPGSGGGDAFLNFMEQELLPYMDRHYHTAPYRMLTGKSLGGLITLHAFQTKTKLFNAYLAVSPSLWYDDELMLKNLPPLLADYQGGNRFVSVSLASETGRMSTAVRIYAETLTALAPPQLETRFHFIDGEDHDSTNLLAVYRGLRSLFESYACPKPLSRQGFTAVEKHYQGLTQKYGFLIPVEENLVNGLGYGALSQKDFAQAEAIFGYNVKHHPKSPNVYDSLGEAYESGGKLKDALAHYAKAVKLAEKTGDPNLHLFRANLERLQSKAKDQ